MNIHGINGTQGVAPIRQPGAIRKNDAARRAANPRDEMNVSVARETTAATNANSDIRLDLVNRVRAEIGCSIPSNDPPALGDVPFDSSRALPIVNRRVPRDEDSEVRAGR